MIRLRAASYVVQCMEAPDLPTWPWEYTLIVSVLLGRASMCSNSGLERICASNSMLPLCPTYCVYEPDHQRKILPRLLDSRLADLFLVRGRPSGLRTLTNAFAAY